jgi:hypothetical protein
LRFFVLVDCGVVASGNNRGYVYENDVVCENFVFVLNGAFLDVFEFMALRDNVIRSITMPFVGEEQYPMIGLGQTPS